MATDKNRGPIIMGMAISLLFGALIVLIATDAMNGSSELVNIVEFGERLCESKGLVYHKYEMIKDKQGYSTVPKIYCKKNELSVYDGVVVLGE